MRVEVFKAIKKRHAAARINAEPSRTSRFLNLIFLGKPPPRVPLENEKRKIGPYKQKRLKKKEKLDPLAFYDKQLRFLDL
jgi:hypothetical protein